jgi:hypothetical protein
VHTHIPCALHCWVLSHCAQSAPPIPHVVLLDVWQWPLVSQHPLGHEFLSQTHAPWGLHSWSLAQTEHRPPLTPQVVFEDATHDPLLQQPLQLLPPQVHAPPEHPWLGAHIPHALPWDPHALTDWAAWSTQSVPWQHPPAHELPSHTHC